MKLTRTLLTLLFTAFVITGCSTFDGMFGGDDDKILPGERISILQLQKSLKPDDEGEVPPFLVPKPWRNEFWPQNGGYPSHSMQHLLLGDSPLKNVWKIKIGRGSTDGLPLTAQPIIVDGTIFALDTDSTLSSFDIKTRRKNWDIDVKDKEEDDPVIAGGLAYSKGLIYVTNGYDELLSVDPKVGKILWRAALPAPARAAPTVIDGRVFVTTLDNRFFALSAVDGQILWDFSGISEMAGLIGAASPAANREIVVPAFSSGEIFALRVQNGTIAWAENLSSLRHTSGLSALSDIRGLPVMDRGLVIAVSFGGRLTAIDERTGERVWHREIGGSETPWVAENYIFMISSDSELVALDRTDGRIHWVTQLPKYKDPEDREGNIFWTGPILAGGRLVIASTDGRVLEISAQNGDLVHSQKTRESFRIAPLVAGETLYLLAESGSLLAFR